MTISLWSLQESARLSTVNRRGIQAIRSHLVLASCNVCKHSKALCRGLCTSDVSSLKTASIGRSILGRLWHLSWLAAFDDTDLHFLTIFISVTIDWVERVRAAFRLSLHLCHIIVVVSCETARVLSRLVSLLSSSSSNIINFQDITGDSALHGISLGSSLINVVDVHGVADELGRGGRTHLDLRDVVLRVQRVIGLSLGLELDDLRMSKRQILRSEICLILVEADMKGSWSRPINIPVGIGELRLVNLLGAMKLGDSTCITNYTMSVITL